MKLTKEQQKLVEDNHNLIYWYAKHHNFNIDDVYDDLAIGLCKASKIYNSEKGLFPTLACKCMKNQLLQTHEKTLAKKRIPNDKISHYDHLWEINSFNNSSCMTDSKVISREITNNAISKISKLLNDNEKNVLYLLLRGYKIHEIAKIENRYSQNIHRNIRNIRKKITNSKILDEYYN